MTRDGFLQSIWQAEVQTYIPINAWDKQMIYDAIIIGGGITGLTTAFLLQAKGKKCILCEAANIGFGSTGGTTAHLNTMLDTTFNEAESDFGEENASLLADSAKEAISLIEALSIEHKIDCDFKYTNGYLFSQNQAETKQLGEIIEASKRAGIQIDWTDDIPIAIPIDQACKFGSQAQFNVGKYLLGLAAAFEKAGGTILQNSRVNEISKANDIHDISTPFGKIRAINVVYATHIPPGINIFSFKCAPYRSYAMAFTIKDGNFPSGLVYDMEEPYHYFRTYNSNNKKYIIAGGFDHKTGHQDNTEYCFTQLEAYLRKYFDIDAIEYKWSSQYYVPVDGLPYIGPMPGGDNTYVATGFNGNGMIFGTLSGKIITDAILNIDNSYAKLFSPSRIKPIAGFADFVKENADVVSQFVKGRFSYEQIESLSDLARGEAKIVEWENEKIALYKDEDGKIWGVSPVCPHAKCIVSWNNAEKTWDCPCHGGRYSYNGTLLTGPAKTGLSPVIYQPIDGD